MEIVKFVLSYLIESDLDMYYEPTDTPAVARSSSLIEELGQVTDILQKERGWDGNKVVLLTIFTST
jgi:phospholipid-transporting ATPase